MSTDFEDAWQALLPAPPASARTGSSIPCTEGGFATPHLDAKAEANAFFTELRVPTTFLQAAYYYESLTGGALTRNPQGDLVLSLPLAGLEAPLGWRWQARRAGP